MSYHDRRLGEGREKRTAYLEVGEGRVLFRKATTKVLIMSLHFQKTGVPLSPTFNKTQLALQPLLALKSTLAFEISEIDVLFSTGFTFCPNVR